MRKQWMLIVRARITELKGKIKNAADLSERIQTRKTLFTNIELLEELKGESNAN